MNDTDFRTRTRPAAPATDTAVGGQTRVLVADDDPASCRFLGDGLRHLGAQVTTCVHGDEALARVCAEHYDLLLLDCRMPGAGALAILSALRADPLSACHASIAVASSADDHDRQVSEALLAGGFHTVLHKPCALLDLHELLMLVPGHRRASNVLDDGSGLSSSGDRATLRALRALLRAELVALDAQLDVLAANREELGERLHRLRASCGFCGAAELAGAATTLAQEIRQHDPVPASLVQFRRVLHATVCALDAD
ncbi:MAG: response regulator [Rhodanobacter sp.]